MENLVLSFHVISPMLFLLAVGFLLNQLGFLNEEVNRVMNRVVALILLPVLVFTNIYNSKPENLFNGQIILFCIVGISAEFLIAYFLVKFFQKDRAKCGVMLQGMFRSNYVIFGITIAVSIYGSEGSSAAAVLTMIVIPMYNILAVVALELFKDGKIKITYLLKKVVTNPLIIASLLGILFSALKWQLPAFVFKPVSDLASCATPMAFVFLGATFAFNSMKEHAGALAATVAVRLVVFPALILGIAILLGVRGVWLVVLLAIFASPTAVSSFSLSQTLGGDYKLAGNIVVFTSICSILTMFLWIFAFKSFGLL